MIRWLWRKLRTVLSEATSGTKNPAQWLIDWCRGDDTGATPSRITSANCLRYAPVWYAVRRISGHVAQLPLIVYERQGERRKSRATKHPAYRLAKASPNPFMTASVFRELIQYHALIWGNGRAAIDRNLRGEPTQLVPLLPEQTKTVIVNNIKWHVTSYINDAGQPESRKFRDENVLHIQGLGYDGIVGYELWRLAAQSWGLGLAAEGHGTRIYKTNAIPGLLLEAPPGVFTDDEDARKFLREFRDMHEGMDNAGRTALLRNGVKASKLSFTPEEAQAVEARMFQRGEVALWFLLEAITGDDKSVSYSSLEQKHLAYLVNCLNGWLVKWQEQCESKLLTQAQRDADSHFFRFNTGALLRSDMKTTYETLAMGVRAMLITPNEARDMLDLDARDDGDNLMNPAITPNTP